MTAVDRDARFTAYPRAKHTVEFEVAKVPEWKALVRESYDLAKAKAKPGAAKKKKKASSRA